jgi:hypothetical protein
MNAPLDAALAYAANGWRVFPCGWQGARRKRPLTKNGYRDATCDNAHLAAWWRRWPRALIGVPTGRESGFVVLDIDPGHGGLETMATLGFPTLPATPAVRTAGGGFHLYFAPPPDREIRNTEGRRGRGIGAGLDWRGEGGYVIWPSPGGGYEWLTETIALPLAPVPEVLLPRLTATTCMLGTPATGSELSDYGEAALRSAAEKILRAPNGEQEATLNGEAFSIGRLAGAGGVPAELALEILIMAANGIASYDPRRPWRPGEAERKVRGAFAKGRAKPRPAPEEVERELDRLFAEARDVH